MRCKEYFVHWYWRLETPTLLASELYGNGIQETYLKLVSLRHRNRFKLAWRDGNCSFKKSTNSGDSTDQVTAPCSAIQKLKFSLKKRRRKFTERTSRKSVQLYLFDNLIKNVESRDEALGRNSTLIFVIIRNVWDGEFQYEEKTGHPPPEIRQKGSILRIESRERYEAKELRTAWRRKKNEVKICAGALCQN